MTIPLSIKLIFLICPAWVADQIPGASLSNNVWILTDSTNQLVYQIRMNGTQLTVKNFNIASWMEGGAVAGMTTQNSLSTGATFLGFQPNIQTSIVTDGHEILRFTPGTSGVEITEIIVPASIPVSSIINWSSGYSQSTSGVTNWRLINGKIYYIDPADSLIYAWDMDPLNAPTAQPIGDQNTINFLF